MNCFQKIADDVVLGKNVWLADFVNLYGCSVGENSKIGTFVEIQKGVSIGKLCKISSHSFICEGVTIQDNCFIGHAVVFINDKFPRAVNSHGELENEIDWKPRFEQTIVGKGVTIGSNSTILCGLQIGDNAFVGAGSTVTRSIPPGERWAGNPARKI